MTFRKHVEEIVQTVLLEAIKQQGYVLETEICNMICEKYNISSYIVRGTLGRIYPGMSLLKRRMSNDLKRFYGLKTKGYPIVYMPEQ
ncbi:MAG: hypothetical protein K2O59_04560 [Lachnospiraceae bacterium]|nr:hypothetical protein [Lachnospiraceae bacterium]